MRLFATAFWITLRHSSRRLLCLFCLLAVGSLLTVAVVQSRPEQETPVAVIGVVDLDGNPMAAAALKLLANSRELKPLFRLEFVEQTADKSAYSAVLMIPEGFTQSVLTGENLAPMVELNPGSPLEAMWARQMARAGASYLTSAQLGIYGVMELAGPGLDAAEYEALLTKVNIAFAQTFLNRFSLLEQEQLSTSGALNLPQYYGCAAGAALLLCYGFLFAPAVLTARSFRRALRGRRGGAALWLASFAHILLLELAAVFAASWVLLAVLGRMLSAGAGAGLAVLAVLAAAFAMLMASLSRSEAVCAVSALLFGLGSALASGGLVPLAMMPPVFEGIAPFLPTWQCAELLSVLFGGQAALLPALAMAAVFLAASLVLWRLDGVWERRRGV